MFLLKSQLPKTTQVEIDRVLKIPASQRTTKEAALLVALAPYLTNEVLEYDPNKLILRARGLTVPDEEVGFAKGASFIKKDATGRGLYENVGDETSASWDLAEAIEKEGTPFNAAIAKAILNVTGTPSEGDTVKIGFAGKEVIYKLRAAIGAGAYASKILTLSGVAANGEDVTLGTIKYEWIDTFTEAKATGTLEATDNPHDGARVTIGSTVYIFRDTLAVAYDVKIGVDASTSLDNLIAAINGAAGVGTKYGTGTVAHPDVVAVAGAEDTMDVTAKEVGEAGNLVTTVEYSPFLTWEVETMTGGVNPVPNEVLVAGTAELCIDNLVAAIMGGAGEGTVYSTGTIANDLVEAEKSSASTMTATALEIGFVGNDIDIGENVENGAWAGGAVKLGGGIDPQAPYDVLIGANAEAAIDNLVLAITAGAGVGVKYGTGTVVHPDVTASKKDADEMNVTAKVAGGNANDILISEESTNMNFGGKTKLEGGVDGTVGAKNDMLIDSSYLYIAVNDNTITGTNWRRIALGSAYY